MPNNAVVRPFDVAHLGNEPRLDPMRAAEREVARQLPERPRHWRYLLNALAQLSQYPIAELECAPRGGQFQAAGLTVRGPSLSPVALRMENRMRSILHAIKALSAGLIVLIA